LCSHRRCEDGDSDSGRVQEAWEAFDHLNDRAVKLHGAPFDDAQVSRPAFAEVEILALEPGDFLTLDCEPPLDATTLD